MELTAVQKQLRLNTARKWPAQTFRFATVHADLGDATQDPLSNRTCPRPVGARFVLPSFQLEAVPASANYTLRKCHGVPRGTFLRLYQHCVRDLERHRSGANLHIEDTYNYRRSRGKSLSRILEASAQLLKE